MSEKTIHERLAAPFRLHELLWRPGGKGTALVYIEARSVMDRLDAVLGPENWRTTMREWRGNSTLCRLWVCINGVWTWREDGAEESQIEAVKGSFSDSLKRAAVQLSVGRYLYRLPDFRVPQNAPAGWFPPMPDWALADEDKLPGNPPAASPPPSKPKPAPKEKREQAKPQSVSGAPPLWGEKITDQHRNAGNYYQGMTWADAWDMDRSQFYAWVKEVCEEITDHWKASGKKYELTEEDKRFGVAASYLEPLMRSKPK